MNQNQSTLDTIQQSNMSSGVKYILDFDGVIFDINALKQKMTDLNIPLTVRTSETFQLIEEGDPAFDFKHLVFPDAREFILQHASDCIIVSSYVSRLQPGQDDERTQCEYQTRKIHLSGMRELGIQDIRVVGGEKRYALAELQEQYKENCVFIDDRMLHIEEAQSLGMRTIHMNREHTTSYESGTPNQNCVTVTSFDEVVDTL